MPNIMICGFTMVQADALKVRIDQAVINIGLGGDAITSIVEMRAESCDRNKRPMPYLRVCSTDEGEVILIVEALKKIKIGVDVEWVILGGFIPADKMSC